MKYSKKTTNILKTMLNGTEINKNQFDVLTLKSLYDDKYICPGKDLLLSL